MLAVPLLARVLPLGPSSSFIPLLQVELRFTVVPVTHDVAACAILLCLPHVYQIHRVPCLPLLLALRRPFMQEHDLTRHRTLIKLLVDRRVRCVGIGSPAKLHVIEVPWHGGGAGGTYVSKQ